MPIIRGKYKYISYIYPLQKFIGLKTNGPNLRIWTWLNHKMMSGKKEKVTKDIYS